MNVSSSENIRAAAHHQLDKLHAAHEVYVGSSTDQAIDALPWNLHADVDAMQARTAQPPDNVIDHLAVTNALLQTSHGIVESLFALLYSSTIVWNVAVLVGGE